ncbi:type II toxin-antitoxin system HicB family antitoxin [Methylobacterium planeticum]|uniref:Uncharacterized protein n=1 Tax=Methylobacterium planeticum TaxID=2615211 RepID=A0A6N6MVZ0_9HYPH|nr:hypothetical protein [Methylobacterium planeticum]KAB1075332.1 hypothetical protein F6X51_05480 [Methylobacterium planeticum]
MPSHDGRFTLKLSPDDHLRLAIIAARRRRSMTEIVLEALLPVLHGEVAELSAEADTEPGLPENAVPAAGPAETGVAMRDTGPGAGAHVPPDAPRDAPCGDPASNPGLDSAVSPEVLRLIAEIVRQQIAQAGAVGLRIDEGARVQGGSVKKLMLRIIERAAELLPEDQSFTPVELRELLLAHSDATTVPTLAEVQAVDLKQIADMLVWRGGRGVVFKPLDDRSYTLLPGMKDKANVREALATGRRPRSKRGPMRRDSAETDRARDAAVPSTRVEGHQPPSTSAQ